MLMPWTKQSELRLNKVPTDSSIINMITLIKLLVFINLKRTCKELEGLIAMPEEPSVHLCPPHNANLQHPMSMVIPIQEIPLISTITFANI